MGKSSSGQQRSIDPGFKTHQSHYRTLCQQDRSTEELSDVWNACGTVRFYSRRCRKYRWATKATRVIRTGTIKGTGRAPPSGCVGLPLILIYNIHKTATDRRWKRLRQRNWHHWLYMARVDNLRCVSAAENYTADKYYRIDLTKSRKHLTMNDWSWNTFHDFVRSTETLGSCAGNRTMMQMAS